LSLEQLIIKCKKNDAKAQSQLYKLFSGKLFTLCLKYSKNHAEAEDNLQDAFITVFDKIGQYKSKGSFEGWIKRVTINTALQRYRSKEVFRVVNEEQIEDVVVEVEDDGLTTDYLLGLIQELPDRYRLVFNLYALDGYSHKEIADMLKISIGTSKSNLARARMILKDKITKHKARNNSLKYENEG
jgi:RNA polymerase sigma-70 factor (ECF subfamily)